MNDHQHFIIKILGVLQSPRENLLYRQQYPQKTSRYIAEHYPCKPEHAHYHPDSSPRLLISTSHACHPPFSPPTSPLALQKL